MVFLHPISIAYLVQLFYSNLKISKSLISLVYGKKAGYLRMSHRKFLCQEYIFYYDLQTTIF
ncbi:hypothetical protein BpHYR1_005146 [Brachionus plicatilis]|uniref:Uncharacterized protein n=1 Tax=Brachionus plicatilis TaxID=10195 RepID=A0A3M7SPS7_BRAPC|nr:hypothetical protein BpHYR1_005146 [Brachionus plicatilis]